MSYKLLFIIAAANDFKIEQMDIKTAFLYSGINTEIYIEQPKGIGAIGELYKVYKLNKVLYGLKQLLYIWYFTLIAYLKTLSFKPLTANNCIFYDSKGIYITIFINNFFIVSLSKANIFIIKVKLSKYFYITDLSPYKYYLKIEVIRD
jgi:Reverse transcriptase (RNA-dependent DNA polymerase)